ncbi:MAG: UDP-N-acetylmuramoyl-tripeptide--D-alanyl-D-alanine ligase [Firmicutes bacterium]|nr:UDP-N-acetylmuramoyl-tripeptide--D-alanyl-D-alanine ligase [Bacillota bacterium]
MFNILWLIAFAVAYGLFLQYLMHMFQLNSYKRDEQTAWMKRSPGRLAACCCIPLVMLILSLFKILPGPVALLLWAAAILPAVRRQKAKKPLVYTARVNRMLVTHAIILVLILILTGIFAGRWLLTAACAMYLLLPVLIFLVNTINAPVQKAVNRSYVNDAKRKLEDMKKSGLTVVGITGSYGKTSVKFFLTDLLSGKYNVLCTPKNYNTDLGVTKTIREDLNATHQIFVCEMGARRVRDIQDICDIVHPEYGIITSIGPQHLETFGSIDNIIATKFELYNSIPDDGTVFLNYDNEYIRNYHGDRNQKGFGRDAGADFRLESLEMSSSGSRFTVSIEGETAEFTTDLIGEYNILDILAAISAAYTLGVSVKELVRRVKKLRPVEHRLQLLPKTGRVSIIDDAYNSNPNGFRGAVDTISFFDAVKVLVTPGMIELGEKEYELNYEAGRHAAEVCDYIILVGRNQTKPLQDAVRASETFDSSHLHVVDRLEQMWPIVNSIPGDRDIIVLLENDLPDNY